VHFLNINTCDWSVSRHKKKDVVPVLSPSKPVAITVEEKVDLEQIENNNCDTLEKPPLSRNIFARKDLLLQNIDATPFITPCNQDQPEPESIHQLDAITRVKRSCKMQCPCHDPSRHIIYPPAQSPPSSSYVPSTDRF
jgi:hypothetical protein